jgi:hypothetical protein
MGEKLFAMVVSGAFSSQVERWRDDFLQEEDLLDIPRYLSTWFVSVLLDAVP